MDKTFREVFPGLKADDTLRGLFPVIGVSSLKYSAGKEFLLVYLRVRRLCGSAPFRALEKLIDEQILADTPCRAKIVETYILPETYTLQDIVEEYREELSSELSEGHPIGKRFYERAEFSVLPGEEIHVVMDDHPLTRKDEARRKELIRELFRVRFAYDVKVTFSYRKAESGLLPDTLRTVILEKPPESENQPDGEREKKEESAKQGGAIASDGRKSRKKKGDDQPGHGQISGKSAAASAASPGALRRGSADRKGAVQTKKNSFTAPADPNVIYGRAFSDEIRDIVSYADMDETPCVLQGRIMSFEAKEMRNGERSILSFAVTDLTDSISCSLFVPNETAAELSPKLSPGTVISVKGMIRYSGFAHETTVQNIQGIMRSDRKFGAKRADQAPEKRVELHCHTKASENDALGDVTELLKLTKSWGHRAMAITDHGCVYAFPDAFHLKPGLGDFKIIYGMEGYLVDDTKRTVTNADERPLSAPAVVFDIETTGFSPVSCRIIEIGAVRLEGGRIIDRFSSFVNPEGPIPYRIENLTGISDETVKDAPVIAEVLPAFLKFAEGAYLVAHNADFDVSFLKENAKRLQLYEKPFTFADTLGLSRFWLPHKRDYKLDSVAKELSVSLKNHHRAVDDAECTAQIYLKLMKRAQARGFSTLRALEEGTAPDADIIKRLPSWHVVILIANEVGRQNLYHLISDSSLKYFGGHPGRPRIPKSLLSERREGLILGSACSMGEFFNAVIEGAPDGELMRLGSFYDYLEIQPLGNNHYLFDSSQGDFSSEEDLRRLNKKVVEIGEKLGKPVCATCDVHFINPEDEIYRRILQAGIHFKDVEGQAPLYLRTTDEMLREFSYLGAAKAYEVVVRNTNMIADRIEDISPVRPDKCPPVIENSDNDLRDACYLRAHSMYGDPLPEIVKKRLDRELNAIISNGYAVMYMIAQKLVHKSVSDGYLVGSRGSVGSSLAATMSGITEVNPLPPHYRCPNCRFSDFDSELVKSYESGAGCDMPDRDCPRCGTKMIKDGFNIPFETFLGFTGNKEPDIDLNFSGEYQSKAHAYTEVIFGKGQTFRAGTIGTVAEKTAFGYVKHYFEENNAAKRDCEITRIASGIVGVRRTSGQHPGGIVVLPLGEDINTFTPVQHPANDQTSPIITTHFEYHSIDHNLLKLDILGHDDPTMIRMLQDLTGRDPTTFPLDSKEVMSLFQNTSALGIRPEDIRGTLLGAMGIPEFGTDNAISMVLSCKPRFFSDLVRISGLAHGTDVWAGNASALIENGTADISTVICCRDDIMEYLIGKKLEPSLAFTIMESVRKGKGLKPEWEAEMTSHGVPDWYIWSCKKIKYMFPKAHAAAYVMMAWRIAYCKVFYPTAYYAAYFSIRASGFNYELMCTGVKNLKSSLDLYEARKDKLSDKEKDTFRDMRIVEEMYARGFEFAPIDIYQVSATRFKLTADGRIMPSLLSIDGLGDSAAENIELASRNGEYLSLSDFRARTHTGQSVTDRLVALHILDRLPANDQFSFFDSMDGG